MMNYYIVTILNELVKDDRINSIYGTAKDNNRKVYINGSEHQEYGMDLIFLVDTGDLFKKTIAFTITTNSFSFEIKVIRHYSSESQTFSGKQVKNVTEYIINKTIKFENQDSSNNRYLKVANA